MSAAPIAISEYPEKSPYICIPKANAPIITEKDGQKFFTSLLEPLPECVLPGGVEGEPRPFAVGELDPGSQPPAQRGALDEPEVRGWCLARCEVSGTVFSIGRKDVDAIRSHTALLEKLDHVLEMVEMAQII